jgi:hypothetical protein
MTNVVDFYEQGVAICLDDSNGVRREYVPLFLHERLVNLLRERLPKCSRYEAGRDPLCPCHGQTAGRP